MKDVLNKELKMTMRCKGKHFNQATAALVDFINTKVEGDGTADQWITTFDNNVTALVGLTRSGNYMVRVWEDKHSGR